jgi:hypothetical protein
MTPSRSHIAYQEQRVTRAEEAVRIAKVQKLGATIIKRREGKWRVEVAKLAALRKVAA